MEEEIKMMFQLGQPEGWRNSGFSFNFPSDKPIDASNGGENQNCSEEFWYEIGLGAYSQLEFDLELTLDSGKGCERNKSESSALGGYLFNSEVKGKKLSPSAGVGRTLSSNCDAKDSDKKSMDDDLEQGEEVMVLDSGNHSGEVKYSENKIMEKFPPNDLYLANVLRMSVDCPFPEIRKQAANILFLLKEKGGMVPRPVFDGPSYFMPASDWPQIDSNLDENIEDEEQDLEGDDDVTVEAFNGLQDLEDIGIALESKKARLLSEAFLSSGRIDHSIQLMAFHPNYLEIFLKTHHFLMRGDGPLPYNHRIYISIMAAARYQCSYLMELQKREFLYQGGDPNWLRGLEAAPAKLMALYNINKIMAHRPWVLKKEDFLHLTKKAGWSLSEVVQAVVILAHFHSLSSFIQGCGITPEIDFSNGHIYMDPGNFNTIRSLSEMIGRRGETGGDGGATASGSSQSANPDNNGSSPSVSFAMDRPTSYFGSVVTTSSSNSASRMGTNSSDLNKKQTKSILKKTEVVSSTATANNTISSTSNVSNASSSSNTNLLKDATHVNSLGAPQPTMKKGLGSSVSEVEIIMATMKTLSETSPIEDPEERKKRFENVASSDDSQEKENLIIHHHLHAAPKSSSAIPPEISPFVCDPEFIYEDFAKRGQVSELHTFRIQDYSWEEHGFSLVNRLYAEVGVYLDEKFKVTQNMTYYTMGGRSDVDTTKFRTAVWNYIQCLYGIRHDDYDYGEVNFLLERPLKAYIKTVCCYPERITKADYDNVMREFKHSEKVHVNLMIMEAKIQAELLYALRTIMRFMI